VAAEGALEITVLDDLDRRVWIAQAVGFLIHLRSDALGLWKSLRCSVNLTEDPTDPWAEIRGSQNDGEGNASQEDTSATGDQQYPFGIGTGSWWFLRDLIFNHDCLLVDTIL
jgi:hypothetical protein